MLRSFISILLLSTSGLALASEVNIYSARQEQLIKPLLDQFTQETGIKVNLVTGDADALLSRLQSEGDLSPADILITTDAGRLHRAKDAGVLQSISSPVLEQKIPAHYQDTDNQWFGLSLRARPIFYNKAAIDPKQLSTYEALAKPEFKGKICIRSSANIYNQSLIASMIAADGEKATLEFAKALVKNFARPPTGGDRDQISAAANGICDIAVANTYYFGGMTLSKNVSELAAADKVAIFWPNQEGRGAHVNISGAGVVKTAKNKQQAIQLLEFLVSESSQAWYANANFEYPVVAGVNANDTLQSWGSFKADTVNLSRLGELNRQAVIIMDKAGWR